MTQQNKYRKIMIVPDTDAARAFIKQWKEDNPDATNVSIQVRKHCDGKEVQIDYD